jgi:hypothetical protein
MKSLSLFTSILVSLVLSTGCTAEVADKEVDSPVSASDFTESALTEEAKAELKSWSGAWTAVRRVVDERGEDIRDAVSLSFEENAPSPAQGMRPDNAVVKLIKVDGNYRYRDRSAFGRIGERKDCASIRTEGIDYLYICHQSAFDGEILRHRLTSRMYKANFIPVGPEEVVEQTLWIERNFQGAGKDVIAYRYTINDKLSELITFERPSTAP